MALAATTLDTPKVAMGVCDDGDELAADDVDSSCRSRQPPVLDVLGDGWHCVWSGAETGKEEERMKWFNDMHT